MQGLKTLTKPIVLYKAGITHIPDVGSCAIVEPINHPNHVKGQQVSNTKPVITSPIVRIGAWGEFETENTIYRPAKVMNQDA